MAQFYVLLSVLHRSSFLRKIIVFWIFRSSDDHLATVSVLIFIVNQLETIHASYQRQVTCWGAWCVIFTLLTHVRITLIDPNAQSFAIRRLNSSRVCNCAYCAHVSARCEQCSHWRERHVFTENRGSLSLVTMGVSCWFRWLIITHLWNLLYGEAGGILLRTSSPVTRGLVVRTYM